MFRRLGIFLSVMGLAMALGTALIIGFDFVSQVSFIAGFSNFLVEMNAVGYFLAGLMGILLLVIPVDSYYMIWGTSINLNPSIIISIELLIFFGIIGIWIGFRSSSERINHPLLEAVLLPYLFILVLDIIFIIFIVLTRQFFIGVIIEAIVEGISNRSLAIFVLSNVLENGTIIAVFSAFTNVLLTPSKYEDPLYCENGSVCDF